MRYNDDLPTLKAIKAHLEDLTIHKRIVGRIFDTIFEIGNSGSSKTVDWVNSRYQRIITTDDCVLTFTAPPSGYSITLQLFITHEDSSTAYAYTFPANIVWADNTPLVTSNTALHTNIITFVYDLAKDCYWAMANEWWA
jgi:hypothetical protein